jgi:2-keto-3-deoxy-L-arabinonate dehydratase
VSRPVHGLVPILATPFTDDGRLDTASLRRLVEFQLDCGVDGIATFGMASEGFALTAVERTEVLDVLRPLVDGRIPIVAGVNGTSTATASEQAEAAVAGGATALMVLPPFLVKPSAAQLVDFYGEVASGSGVEVMVQDAPAATGVSMPVALIRELSKLEGVTSVKVEAAPTPPKVAEVVDAVGTDFAVLGGQNAFFVLEEYARGAIGTMPACEFADVLAGVLRDWHEGRREAAHARFTRLLPLIRYGMQGPLAWAVHKTVLVRRGIIASSRVRSPASPLDAGTLAGLDDVLAPVLEGEFS